MIRRTIPRLSSHLLHQSSKLKFSCTECGKCCKGRTNVFVNEMEVSQLAEQLEMY
jgi:Fe-S-cluster containining protein